MTSIYLIGSLRNRAIIQTGIELRKHGYDVFDNWIAAGPEADDYWQAYSKEKGLSYKEALQSYEAKHVFEFDKHHLDRCDMAVLCMPAGKSGHLELGYMAGLGKPTFILFDSEPDRFDVMYQFCSAVCFNMDELVEAIRQAEIKEWPYTKGYEKYKIADCVNFEDNLLVVNK